MEGQIKSHGDLRTERILDDKARYMEEGTCSCSIVLKAKVSELHKTKEDLKQAKENAIQTWLDSRPLIDELEKLQKCLEVAKNRSTMSNIVISELESQLEITTTSIKSKREEEFKIRTMIDEINDELDEKRKEIQKIKMETDEELRTRSRLKQVLKMRKQTLHAMQLTNRALRLESEAYGASAAEALRHINQSQKDNNATVEISVEEYDALIRGAEEESFLTEWLVSALTEQRIATQESRDLAFERLEKLHYPESKSKEKKFEDEITRDGSLEEQEEDLGRASPPAKLLYQASQRTPQELIDVSESSDARKSVRGKKQSVLAQIRKFFDQLT